MKRFLKILLIVLIIGGGFAANRMLASAKKDPEKKDETDHGLVVTVTGATTTSERARIDTMGMVMPSRSVTLFPEVGGRVIAQNAKLVPGGRFKAGEQILRIDPRDYDLALKQQKASVNRAEMELATEKARKSVAEREWELIKDEVQPTEEGRRLALREIQLETAEASLSSASSGLSKAKLARSRTVVKAPFNGVITEEFVDKGQVLGPSSRIATLVDSDTYWVRVSVPVDRLPWIKIPGIRGETEGSVATITHEISSDSKVTREGQVIRLLGDLDMKGKMARLLLAVKDPLKASSDDDVDAELPLFIGAYVNVAIDGPLIEDVVEIPRRALRDGDLVWTKNEGVLAIVPVEVVWKVGDRVFVRGQIQGGDQVVSSYIAAPVEGMKLTLESEIDDEEAPETEEPAVQAVPTAPAEASSAKSEQVSK